MEKVTIGEAKKWDSLLVGEHNGFDGYLNHPGTSNSNKKKERIVCTFHFPCKRMICSTCVTKRGDYLAESAYLFAKASGLDFHLIINWSCQDEDEVWKIMLKEIPELTKLLSGRIGPYVRTIGLGKNHNPHLHYLIRSELEPFIRKRAKAFNKKYPQNKITVVGKKAREPLGLLGYFFDQNFLPLFNDPRRPKRLRILSGSRGVCYGFPSREQIRKLQRMQEYGIVEEESS